MDKDIEIIDDVINSLYDDYEREQDYAQKTIDAWLRLKQKLEKNNAQISR
tara:strand:- start:787 stop:936 length:150 start_codon:yes stop_codon:yes gene_type:complete